MELIISEKKGKVRIHSFIHNLFSKAG